MACKTLEGRKTQETLMNTFDKWINRIKDIAFVAVFLLFFSILIAIKPAEEGFTTIWNGLKFVGSKIYPKHGKTYPLISWTRATGRDNFDVYYENDEFVLKKQSTGKIAARMGYLICQTKEGTPMHKRIRIFVEKAKGDFLVSDESSEDGVFWNIDKQASKLYVTVIAAPDGSEIRIDYDELVPQ